MSLPSPTCGSGVLSHRDNLWVTRVLPIMLRAVGTPCGYAFGSFDTHMPSLRDGSAEEVIVASYPQVVPMGQETSSSPATKRPSRGDPKRWARVCEQPSHKHKKRTETASPKHKKRQKTRQRCENDGEIQLPRANVHRNLDAGRHGGGKIPLHLRWRK